MRKLIPASLLCAAIGVASQANATPQSSCDEMLKDRPFSIVVPKGPGGGYDAYARIMAPRLEALFDVQVRVENLPAAGGLVAFRRLIEASPDEWVVLLGDARDVIEGMQNAVLGEGAAARYRLAAVFHLEPSAWVTRPGFDPVAPEDGKLVVGTTQAPDLSEMLAMANALSLPTTIIDGYEGSSAMSLGLMAGEVDLVSASLGTALRLARSGDLSISAVLSDGPWAKAGDLPYLLGSGGVLERRLAALPDVDADRARMLGELIVGLSAVTRVVVVPMSLETDHAACLDHAIKAVMADPAFQAAAAAEGRSLDTPNAADADAAISRLFAAIAAFEAIAPSLTLTP